jgi:pimeloyl-ACP methyl ester carboxylesterase
MVAGDTVSPYRAYRGSSRGSPARNRIAVADLPVRQLNGADAMKSFTTWDDLEIVYQEWGEETPSGPPVVLHHGFVADANVNWVAHGVVDALLVAGRRVVAHDARGHGSSAKPHDPARYGEQRMARDLAVLLDVIAAPQVDLVGYSTGAIVSLIFASEGERVRRLVVGGVGSAPTLILAGEDDPLAVRPEVLADAIPDATLEILSGNHVGAIADPRFIESIVDFLA